jgi:hypothetical protein
VKADSTPPAALRSVHSAQYSLRDLFVFPPLRLSIFLPCLFLVTGCGRQAGLQCYPVKGHVLYQNQPLAEAMVVFHPVAVPLEKYSRPIAHTDAAGGFELTTLKTGDGAPPGEYSITIELREPRQVGEEIVRDGPNLLPPQYASPQSTPLRYKVIAQKNEVPKISL